MTGPDDADHGSTYLIPSYRAIRSAEDLLVRVDLDNSWDGTDPAWEYYRYGPGEAGEATNVFDRYYRDDRVQDLMRRISDFDSCVGPGTVRTETEVPCRTLVATPAAAERFDVNGDLG